MSEADLQCSTIWTIGHSTLTKIEFNHILRAHEIVSLIDVRSFPGSMRYPHFNRLELAGSLATQGIEYHHLPALGGRRRLSPDSKNTAWRNPSFRAYADHMETGEFKQGIDRLLEGAREKKTAVMCAEALWWRCHRSLIADYLKTLGTAVIHIRDEKHSATHLYTSAARVVHGRLSYEGLFSEEGHDA